MYIVQHIVLVQQSWACEKWVTLRDNATMQQSDKVLSDKVTMQQSGKVFKASAACGTLKYEKCLPLVVDTNCSCNVKGDNFLD